MYRSNVPDCSGVVGRGHQFCFLSRGVLPRTVSKEPRKSCLV